MRELSINYPKKAEDLAKITYFCDKYSNESADLVETEMLELTYGDLNIAQASN